MTHGQRPPGVYLNGLPLTNTATIGETAEVTVSIEVQIACGGCGRTLADQTEAKEGKLVVTPCLACLFTATTAAESRGFYKGYDAAGELGH